MKRFISAIALCLSLLVLLILFLFPPHRVTAAKENVLITLLNLPAPPPPNPLVPVMRNRDEKFYDKDTPPGDDAPIDELLDYWRTLDSRHVELGYNPKPSERVLERILAEIEKDHTSLTQYLNILPDGERSADFVKDLYDSEGANGVFERGERQQIKKWLTYHSPYFSNDLARIAQQVGDANEYVTNQDELLALARVDFDKARPLIDRLYADSSQRVSQVLAKWALYRHAMETNALGDIERYRDELKAVVENRSATGGMRDLALDALTKEKEWSGRDEWYYSLLGDETLADLRVNGQSYTGLTTILYYAPDDKYIEKMLEFVRSDNPTIRAAAVRNLVVKINAKDSRIIEALVPWLLDPKWAVDRGNSRLALVRALQDHQIPESVPGLVRMLDEKEIESGPTSGVGVAANLAANAMRPADELILPAANTVPSTNANAAKKGGPPTYFYPYRSIAIAALAKQKDGRAAPALRRVLSEVEGYERYSVVSALLACKGFSIPEQIDAIETAAKRNRDVRNGADANVAYSDYYVPANTGMRKQLTPTELTAILSQQLLQSTEISDELAKAIVDRIEVLDERDPKLSEAYRALILKWKNSVFNILLLRDLKRDAADVTTIVRLVGQRKELREKHALDIFDLQTGKPVGVGIAACLLEDPVGFDTILDTGHTEAKTAMLACARLIRAPLPIAKVAENLKSNSQILQTAAERYLEAEDSPDARALVLARHPNEAKILGATTAFYVEGTDQSNEYLWMLYQSVGDDSLYNGWGVGSSNDQELQAAEKRLQDEVKKDEELLGVYAYDSNFIRIYKDRAIFSWDEDDSRYRERPLTKFEFEDIKSYLTVSKVDELTPFLSCGGGYCGAKQLVMLGRNGGRRVYMNRGLYQRDGTSGFAFFAGLDKYFADLKLTRATLKYNLSREIPGLEIILASDELHAETVWKNGADLRVAASLTSVRKQVKKDIEKAFEDAESNEEVPEAGEGNTAYQMRVDLARKHEYDGYGWHKVVDGMDGGPAEQPPGFEFMPLKDKHSPEPTEEQWKARVGAVEVRAGDGGLYLISRGQRTLLKKGDFGYPVVSPNGRWAVVAQLDDPESGPRLLRINLITRKIFPVTFDNYQTREAKAFVPILNKFLIVPQAGYYEDEDYAADLENGPDDRVMLDPDPDSMMLLDPETGALQPAKNEFRPLSQQTFRPLQKAARVDEYWAALPGSEKNETQIGIYSTKWLTFRPVMQIPKIKFNSMSMWVDEAGGKVYFVYRGHLLALPLASQNPLR